jgi:uncharacterized RDD family membrane protein YckC
MRKDYLEALDREGVVLSSNKKRVLAFMIDELLLSLVFMFMISDQIKDGMTYEDILNVTASLTTYVLGIKFLYQTLFVALYGATVGKIVLKIHIINIDDLEKPSLFLSVIRSSGRALNEIVFYFGFLLAFVDNTKQTVHDKIAKTIVVDV